VGAEVEELQGGGEKETAAEGTEGGSEEKDEEEDC